MKKKFEMVKYNKSLQNFLHIDLIDYKRITGKYIIFDKDGKVKEFEGVNDKLVFEGEYLNGKRNGKGKEYNYKGRLLFEGEYLNNEKWNGKGYDKNGNIIFELKNGKGKVKEYDYVNYDGTIIFEGEYLNGKRNGKGKEYYDAHGFIFEGEYLNGKRWNGKGYNGIDDIFYELKNGKGFVINYFPNEFNSNLIKFEGEFLNGEKNGRAKEYDLEDNLIFEGEYLNNKKHGVGKEYRYNQLIFEGEYQYGYKKKGKKYIKDRLEYNGEYLYDKKWNGKGYDEKGNIIYELKNGKGKVKEYNYDGTLRFEGEYLNGKRNGKVKEYTFRGDLKFEGEYLNGKRNGKGKEYYYGRKLKFEGNYSNDERGGKGIEYNYQGNIVFEGEYLKGEKFNGKGSKSEGKSNYIYEFKQGKVFLQKYREDKVYLEVGYSKERLNGKGRELCTNGNIYEGELKDGSIEGYGIYYFNNDERYEGEFELKDFEGYGIYSYPKGKRSEGEFKNIIKNGFGIYYFSNGDKLECEFKKGVYNGYGIFYSTLGFQYKGYFIEGLYIKILFSIYKILLLLNHLYSLIMKNKITLLNIILLILCLLINN